MTRFMLTLAALAAVLATMPRPMAGQEAVTMIAEVGEAARQWPRWRGPSGQGQVSGTGYVDRWSATENIVWKTAVPGTGNSSPIVWGDRVVVTTARNGGQRLSVLAYARSDGRLLWERDLPDGARRESPHVKNGYASATPSTDGERVYAWFGSRGLAAFRLADGAPVWHRDVGAGGNYHGSAGSPLLYKGRVIVYSDQSSRSFIAAFDARTGAEVWRTARQASVGWGTPVAVRVGDRDEIIINGQHAVTAYEPETGRELWRAGGTTYEVIPTIVVGFGMIYSSSGRAGPTLAIRPGGRGDVTDTHVVWRSPRGSPFVPSPILVDDVLYMVNDMQSIATALDARTGRSVWQGRLGVAQREGFSASPVAVGDKVFFTNDDGETFVLKAGRTFELLHTNTMGESILASPALADGRWYFRTDRQLIAVGAK